MLEQLPSEILQEIFVHSGNLSLPLASVGLKSQLSSQHLYSLLTARVMEPMAGTEPSHADFAAARRLFESRFMTWQFWKAYIDEAFGLATVASHQQASPDAADPSSSVVADSLPQAPTPSGGSVEHYKRKTQQHLPGLSIIPPRKLLHGPWTEDKTCFLTVLARPNILAESGPDSELALEGLTQAVAEGAVEAVSGLLFVGVMADTELLCKAVLDHGCVQRIVELLVQHGQGALNLLEPTIWTWADKARKKGDAKGKWLKEYLSDQMRQNNESQVSPVEDEL
jgi:hypothetical protein